MGHILEAFIFGFFWFSVIFVSCGSMYVIFNVCLVMLLRKIVNDQEERRRRRRGSNCQFIYIYRALRSFPLSPILQSACRTFPEANSINLLLASETSLAADKNALFHYQRSLRQLLALSFSAANAIFSAIDRFQWECTRFCCQLLRPQIEDT